MAPADGIPAQGVRGAPSFGHHTQTDLFAALAELDRAWSAEVAAPRLSRAYKGGDEAAYAKLVTRIERATGTSLPVLIEGPPGGVQSLVALTIHQTGPARRGPFVRVRGGFPPATWRDAAREAGGGSLYVSEVGALAAASQRELLVCLKQAQSDGRPRLLASTDRDLAVAAARGWFLDELRERLFVLRIPTGEQARPSAAPADAEGSLHDLERKVIEARLNAHDWQQQRTADSLGIDRKTLYRKIQRYGLER